MPFRTAGLQQSPGCDHGTSTIVIALSSLAACKVRTTVQSALAIRCQAHAACLQREGGHQAARVVLDTCLALHGQITCSAIVKDHETAGCMHVSMHVRAGPHQSLDLADAPALPSAQAHAAAPAPSAHPRSQSICRSPA